MQKLLDPLHSHKNNKQFTFYATHLLFMNDPQEMYLALNLIHKYLSDVEKEIGIPTKKSLSSFLDTQLEKSNKTIYQYFLENTIEYTLNYIVSFSRANDSLPMWLNYAQSGMGIALGFDETELKQNFCGDNNISIRDVKYGKNDMDEHIKNSIKNYSKNKYKNQNVKQQVENFIELSNSICTDIKNIYFKYEKECRIVKKQTRSDTIKYRLNGKGTLIPYAEIKIPSNTLKEIIIGPCANKEIIRNALAKELKQLGLDVTIKCSKIPYRNI